MLACTLSFPINLGFWRLGLHQNPISWMEPFHVFLQFLLFYLHLGEYLDSVLPWSSRNVLWIMKVHLHSINMSAVKIMTIFILEQTYPFKSIICSFKALKTVFYFPPSCEWGQLCFNVQTYNLSVHELHKQAAFHWYITSYCIAHYRLL